MGRKTGGNTQQEYSFSCRLSARILGDDRYNKDQTIRTPCSQKRYEATYRSLERGGVRLPQLGGIKTLIHSAGLFYASVNKRKFIKRNVKYLLVKKMLQ